MEQPASIHGSRALHVLRTHGQGAASSRGQGSKKKVRVTAIDYDQIEAFLVGQCGMTEKQAALTSLTEYRLRVEGYERQQRQSWEVARWTVWHIYANNPYIKPAQKPKSPMDVCRFAWDEKAKGKPRITRKDCHISKGKEKALNAIYADFMARKQGIETTS